MDFREIKEFFKDFMGYIITFIVIILVFTFVLSFQPIAGNSMSSTLEEGDIILVSKISYLLKDITRFDIVTIKVDGKQYVKRIIGLPGDKIDYLDNTLYINDVPYEEKFLNNDVTTNNFLFEDICSIDKCSEGVIPKNQYLILGDYRNDSFDSRDNTLGLITKNEIKGKVLFKLWPVNRVGFVN